MAKKETTPDVRKEASAPAAAPPAWPSFDTLRREIDRLFEDFHPFGLGRAQRDAGWDMPIMRRTDWPLAPAIDVAEKDDAYEVKAELPGMDETDIELKVHNGTLTIKGEKSEEKEEKQKEFYISERRFGSFQRSFRLPEGADPEKIDARFAKGVLTVTIPKLPETVKKEKRIAVKAG